MTIYIHAARHTGDILKIATSVHEATSTALVYEVFGSEVSKPKRQLFDPDHIDNTNIPDEPYWAVIEI